MLCQIISWNFMSRLVVCHNYRGIPTTNIPNGILFLKGERYRAICKWLWYWSHSLFVQNVKSLTSKILVKHRFLFKLQIRLKGLPGIFETAGCCYLMVLVTPFILPYCLCDVSWRVVINQSSNSLHFTVGDPYSFTIASASFKQVEFCFIGIEKLSLFKIPPRIQRSTRTEESSFSNYSKDRYTC